MQQGDSPCSKESLAKESPSSKEVPLVQGCCPLIRAHRVRALHERIAGSCLVCGSMGIQTCVSPAAHHCRHRFAAVFAADPRTAHTRGSLLLRKKCARAVTFGLGNFPNPNYSVVAHSLQQGRCPCRMEIPLQSQKIPCTQEIRQDPFWPYFSQPLPRRLCGPCQGNIRPRAAATSRQLALRSRAPGTTRAARVAQRARTCFRPARAPARARMNS